MLTARKRSPMRSSSKPNLRSSSPVGDDDTAHVDKTRGFVAPIALSPPKDIIHYPGPGTHFIPGPAGFTTLSKLAGGSEHRRLDNLQREFERAQKELKEKSDILTEQEHRFLVTKSACEQERSELILALENHKADTTAEKMLLQRDIKILEEDKTSLAAAVSKASDQLAREREANTIARAQDLEAFAREKQFLLESFARERATSNMNHQAEKETFEREKEQLLDAFVREREIYKQDREKFIHERDRLTRELFDAQTDLSKDRQELARFQHAIRQHLREKESFSKKKERFEELTQFQSLHPNDLERVVVFLNSLIKFQSQESSHELSFLSPIELFNFFGTHADSGGNNILVIDVRSAEVSSSFSLVSDSFSL